MGKAREEASPQAHYAKRLSLEEYFVDFLGGLVPGMLFALAAPLAVVPPIFAITHNLAATTDVSLFQAAESTLKAIQNTPSALWIIIFVVLVLLAYVVGHLFYRYDPKVADRSSFRRLARLPENDTEEQRRRNLACASAAECEFPYPYYHLYLNQRGLTHLLGFCLWKDDANLRSKIYINLIKARLRFHFPDKCGLLIRNEAHVRLASSTWYLAKVLIWIGSVSALAAVSSAVAAMWSGAFTSWTAAVAWHIPALTGPATVLAMSLFALSTIRRFLHYQRLREVFFVLELAFTAFRDRYALLSPPFSEESLNRAGGHNG